VKRHYGAPLNNIFAFLVIAVIVLLNVMATLAVRRDEFSEPLQKVLQILLVWIIPILGALLVLGVHRKDEKPSGSYRRDHDRTGDEFGSQHLGIRSITEVLDGD
jgi:hypothetical protein